LPALAPTLVTSPTSSAVNTSRRLRWAHGDAELQTLGGMLAPWADDPDADRWPGAWRRLRGEWPCVPVGRCDRRAELPPGWSPRTPGDTWAHGHASFHPWQWLDVAEASP
jgi:hypothetical protein